MTQAQLDLKRKTRPSVYDEVNDSISEPLIFSAFEQRLPPLVDFLAQNELDSTHLHAFGVPLHRFAGDTVGLKLIWSDKLQLHALVDPTPASERKGKSNPGYYSHFFLLWHVLIHRLFLVDANEKVPLLPDYYDESLKAFNVLRLVPTLKSSKRNLLVKNGNGEKTAETEMSTLSYLTGNLMDMLPSLKDHNRHSRGTASRKHMSAIFFDQLYFDTIYNFDKMKGEEYEFDLTVEHLKKIKKIDLYKQEFKGFDIPGDNFQALLETKPALLHEIRKHICVVMLNDIQVEKATFDKLMEQLHTPPVPRVKEKVPGKERKIKELLGDPNLAAEPESPAEGPREGQVVEAPSPPPPVEEVPPPPPAEEERKKEERVKRQKRN